MSIRIDGSKCISCGKCADICPGNLIYTKENGEAFMKYPKECWGCTACLKECPTGAIQYYLGLDMGGKGGRLYIKKYGNYLNWCIMDSHNHKHCLQINRSDSNKY
ncbi:MAG: 4Fe-4S dicluster domain-containing protein [Bacillota bacterium]